MHALEVAASVFGVIFVAELPDKTALSALVMATKYRPWPVFLATGLALTVQSAVAVSAGSLLSLLPPRAVHLGAGAVFLLSAVVMWRQDQDDDREPGARRAADDGGVSSVSFWKAFATVFAVIFMAEWGDLTQFATAALAARERAPWVVLIASTLALWAVAAIAVGIGSRAARFLSPRITRRVASGVFAAVGLALVMNVV